MIKQANNGVTIQIHVQPNSSKNQIVGKHGDRIKIKLRSPPVDGKANECLIEYLSDLFDISKSKVTIIRGETSREKTVHLSEVSLDQAESVLKIQ